MKRLMTVGVCGLALAFPVAAGARSAHRERGTLAASTSTTPSGVQPVGDPGTWKLAFDDEFSGTSLDRSKWPVLNAPTINNVVPSSANLRVSGGNAILTLSSWRSGAAIDSDPATQGWGSGSAFDLRVGDFAEARIDFPGSRQTIYNWPAWWISGPGWPAAGEEDVAEGLGTMTTNYHSPSGANNFGTVSGTWSNGFHTYGLYRGSGWCEVFYDGNPVTWYATDDDGLPQSLILNVGSGNVARYRVASQVKVDYVRSWRPK